MTIRLTYVLPALAALAASTPLFSAEGDAAPAPVPAPATSIATLEAKIAELDQQVKILARNNEVAKEEADNAAAKGKAAIKPGDVQFKVKGYIQARAALGGSATDNRGADQDYYAANAANGDESELTRFSIRRARLGVEGRSQSDWYANLVIRADGVGTSGTTSTGAAAVQVYQAYVGKTFTSESGKFTNDLKLGLDKIYNNDSSNSSTAFLFAGDRSVATLLSSQREAGFGYKFGAPFLRAGFDLQDTANLARNAVQPSTVGNNANSNAGNYAGRPSLAYSFRIEAAPGADYLPAKKQESYQGAYGTQALLGFDFQNSGHTYAVSNEERSLTIFGPDLLLHYDRWTFLADYRWTKLDINSTNGDLSPQQLDSLHGGTWDAQIGYAIPTDSGVVIEPALRFAVVNWAKDIDERSQWGVNNTRDNNVITPTSLLAQGGLTSGSVAGGTTNLGSGSQLDIGINLYWNGNANKTQLSYTWWEAEAGPAKASAFILQQQLVW